MSQLTAHIVYATYQALDSTQREAFMQLIDKDKKKYQSKKPVKKPKYDIEALAMEIYDS